MTAAWVVGGASVRGAAHRRRDLPNQDAIAWLPQEGAAEHFVAAVSDGHGAAAHPLSDVGSRLAVAAASAVLDWHLTEGGDAHALAGQVLDAWRAAVGRHAAASVPAGDWVEPAGDKLLPYGATLLGVAATGQGAVALQIGDGDLLLGYPDGRLERPLPDDAELVGEQTYSLCSPDALLRFRVAVVPARPGSPPPDFALLSTDGISKSFPDEAAFRAVAGHYRTALLTAGPEAVLRGLPGWLDEVSQRGSGDDVTLCLAVRRGA